MRDDNENIEFENKYKEHIEIDTPNLWSRIEAGIDGVKPGSSEDKNSNEVINNKENNKNSNLTKEQVYTIRKTLLMVACFSVVVLMGITIKEKLFGEDLIKSNSKTDSMSSLVLDKDTNNNQSAADTSIDSEENNQDKSETNTQEQSKIITKQIEVIAINEDIGDTYVINARLLDEEEGSSKNIDIYTSGKMSQNMKIGNTYEVNLEYYNSENEYHLKDWNKIK